MEYRSYDPFRHSLIRIYETDDNLRPDEFHAAVCEWKDSGLPRRMACFESLAVELERISEDASQLITLEMGKPVNESRQELKKCIHAVRALVAMAPGILTERTVVSEAKSSRIIPEPFGLVLAVMPWNFPFWQVLRFAVPAMLAGNTVVLKHAPNVPGCAAMLQTVFEKAGFPKHVFTNKYLSEEGVRNWLAHPIVSGFAFTGSDRTGAFLAALAGSALKKSMLELGGNDPMLVFEDAEIEDAVASAVVSRCINGGQACNGAKRFLIHRSIHDDFVKRLTEKVAALKTGDPLDASTDIGPIARLDLLEKLNAQFLRAIDQGAIIEYRADVSKLQGWFFPPTVLTGVTPGNIAFEEELFGPVWSVTAFDSEADAIRLANRSVYGLGASVWTKDEGRIERIVSRLETGNVFINDFVRSDPRFPFGGVKRSGFGKDLGEQGFLEFVNWKTVYRKS